MRPGQFQEEELEDFEEGGSEDQQVEETEGNMAERDADTADMTTEQLRQEGIKARTERDNKKIIDQQLV